MNKSETIGELAKALVNVQKVLEGAKKDSTNPFFKSKYADLSSVWEACRKPLTANGLAVIQTMDALDGNDLIIETILVHISGEWIGGHLALKPVKDDPQGIGSAITYGRRYALAAIVGVCPEDDDAEQAMSRANPPKATSQAPQRIEQASETTSKGSDPGRAIYDLRKGLEKLGYNGDEGVEGWLSAHNYGIKELKDAGVNELAGIATKIFTEVENMEAIQ